MIIRPSKLNCANWTGDQPDRPFKRASSIVYEAVENGERVGCIRADAGGGDVSVHYVQVRHQRKGVGTKLYEAAARGACKRFGLPLSSDVDLQTGSEAFWKKQVRKGRAHYDADIDRYVLSCPAPASLAASAEAEPAIRAKEREIVKQAKEHGALFEPDGRLVFHKKGRSKSKLPMTEDELAQFPGRIFTHNHPPSSFTHRNEAGELVMFKAGGSLSPADVKVASQHDLAEIRVVTETPVDGKLRTVVFTLERPEKGWPSTFTTKFFLDSAMRHATTMAKIDISSKRKPYEEVAASVMDRAWSDVAPRLGMKYESMVLDGAALPRRRRRR